jgi:topoisomerase-4 subunit A
MGRLMAYVKIDEIIKLIRSCEDQPEAKNRLREKYKFSERQAEDIVNLRLGQLTKLDGVKLNEERKGLEADRKGLKEILGDEGSEKADHQELNRTPTFGDNAARSSRPRARRSSAVLEEPITMILSVKGWCAPGGARRGHDDVTWDATSA